MALDPGVDQRRGEGAIVEIALDHIAHRRGREIVRRRENRHHRPRQRVAPDRAVSVDQEREDSRDRQPGEDHRQHVEQPMAQFLRLGRRGDDALGESDRDGQAFVGAERAGGHDRDLARLLLDHLGGALGRALTPGVERALAERHRLGQMDLHPGLVDRKLPTVAGDVPIELVIILEETELASDPIMDLVEVPAGRDEAVGRAELDPDAVALVLDVVDRPPGRRAWPRRR